MKYRVISEFTDSSDRKYHTGDVFVCTEREALMYASHGSIDPKPLIDIERSEVAPEVETTTAIETNDKPVKRTSKGKKK
ncbi:MAG: hypothetical protein KC517_09205 [Bacteroidetes bacterium]|nr:hypothetical protein [Bacteroidota bacterium]